MMLWMLTLQLLLQLLMAVQSTPALSRRFARFQLLYALPCCLLPPAGSYDSLGWQMQQRWT